MAEAEPSKAVVPALNTLPAVPDTAKPATQLVSADELARARALAAKIDLANPTAIATFGDDAQKKVGDFADKFLGEVRMRDSGKVGDDLNELEALVRGANTEAGGGTRRAIAKVPVLGKLFFSLDGYFASVKDRVDQIVERLESHREQLIRDNALFEQMRDRALQNRHELLVYAASGELAMEEASERLPGLKAETAAAGDPERGLALRRFEDGIERLDIQVTNLKEFAYAQLVAAPQIDTVVQTNLRLVSAIATERTLLVPLWKQTLALRLGLQRQADALEASEATRAAARQAMTEAARVLRENAVGTARSASQPILGIDTLEEVTNSLLATIDEVKTARQEGAEARANLVQQLGALTDRLGEALSGAAVDARTDSSSP
jgi:uncharacterized protein YaaN involved in tellurite resistance